MHSYETPGSVSLQIKLPSGRVVVATADQPQTTVEVVPLGRRGQDAVDEIEVTMDERQGRHVVRIEQRDRFRWGPIQISWGGDFECRIACPAGADLDLSGGSTDLRVEGELGEIAVRTASGDIKLATPRGGVQVKTASGDVTVGSLGAPSSIATVSGDLSVDRLDAALNGRSVSGDVTVGIVSGELAFSTTSGDFEIKSVLSGDVRVQTVSGDVRVGIAPGTRVWIDAASVSGDLGSELGIEDQEPSEEGEDTVVPRHVKNVSGAL
jgi:hypothetical protein